LIEALQHLLTGLSVGAIYALIALGYTMVFGVLQLINFAHGDVVMVGAFVAYYLSKWMGASFSWGFAALAFAVSMAACAALGFVIERAAYRPLRSRPRITALITAIGVSMLLENGGQLLFGAQPVSPGWTHAAEIASAPVTPAPAAVAAAASAQDSVQIPAVAVATLAIALAIMMGLQFIVFRTRFGLAMRAVAHDPRVASLMGIPVDSVISKTFMLGSALAAAAGLIYSLTYPKIEPFMGLQPGLKAFIAAVLGGIGNVPGAMLGGLVLGLSEEFVAGYVSSALRDAFAFMLLIGVLLFKPTGLMGSSSIEKV
jgi:branched-chain amino acid transport system permease protein